MVCTRQGITATTRSVYGHHHSYLGKEKRGLLLAGSSSSHASSFGDRVVLVDTGQNSNWGEVKGLPGAIRCNRDMTPI